MKNSNGIITMRAVIIFGMVLGMVGCATNIPIKSVRAPTIDTTGIQRLAIRPFENRSGTGAGSQLAQYLTDAATQKITATGRFTIVAANDPNADGVFTGMITSIGSRDSQSQNSYKDRNGNTVEYTTYNREVSVAFSYSVISSRTNMPIGTVQKQGSTNSSGTSWSDLQDTLTLAMGIANSRIGTLTQDVVPTIVTTNRTLMDETSSDKNVKNQMKTALALVKNGSYEEAVKEYDEIYSRYGSVAARTNANILRESIASDTTANAQLAQLFNDKDSLANKAVKNTVDVLNSKLPSGSNIMIVKSSTTERNMLDVVVDEITKTVVQDGKLTVVDRSNDDLISAEQQHQLSGDVDDNTAVSIGKQLGVRYAVLCWISGAMSGRRLNLRLLNIETAAVIEQTDFEI